MFPSASLFFPFFHFPPLFMLMVLFLYFLPAFLARNKPSFTGIFVLNLLTGWTFIGWLIALVWAIVAEPQRQTAPPFQPATASAPQSAASPVFFCSSCGKRCTAGEHFCSSCGAALPAVQR